MDQLDLHNNETQREGLGLGHRSTHVESIGCEGVICGSECMECQIW